MDEKRLDKLKNAMLQQASSVVAVTVDEHEPNPQTESNISPQNLQTSTRFPLTQTLQSMGYNCHDQFIQIHEQKIEGEEKLKSKSKSKPKDDNIVVQVNGSMNGKMPTVVVEEKCRQKSDKAVSTHGIASLEDLQKALTYEAIFHVLLEQKMQAMKRDADEERKQTKCLKRKMIGKIFFTKRHLNDIDSRTDEFSCRETLDGDDKYLQTRTEPASSYKMSMPSQKAPLKNHILRKDSIDHDDNDNNVDVDVNDVDVDDDNDDDDDDDNAIKTASPASSSQHSRPKSKMKSLSTASALQRLPSLVKPTMDDSVASTLSNSSITNGDEYVKRCHLLVQVQTHISADHSTDLCSSSSEESNLQFPLPTIDQHLVQNSTVQDSIYHSNTNDTMSLGSDTTYSNGTTDARLHTSTLADDSLTSIRDSIESLSVAIPPYLLSDASATTHLYQEPFLSDHVKTMKRQRILEAKSISAQCSPILRTRPFTKTIIHKAPSTDIIRESGVSAIKSSKPFEQPNVITCTATITAASISQMSATNDTLMPQMRTPSPYSRPKLMKQYSYKDDGRDIIYSRDITRQNIPQDSGTNITTVRTLYNQSDTLSWHAGGKDWEQKSTTSTSRIMATSTSTACSIPCNELSTYLSNRHKSKSIDLLLNLKDDRQERPLTSATILPTTILSLTTPLTTMTSIATTGRISSEASSMLQHLQNMDNNFRKLQNVQTEATDTVARSLMLIKQQQQYNENKKITSAIMVESNDKALLLSHNGIDNGGTGIMVPTITTTSDTALLQRMISTSTGSSIAQSGCCATTMISSSREKDKQQSVTKTIKPYVVSGHTGSDDEYHRRKRKYRRFHRCSDPALVYPTLDSLTDYIITIPTSDIIIPQYPFNEDYPYDTHLQIESDKIDDDLEQIMMIGTDNGSHKQQRHRKHRHHRHKKRRRHKKRKIFIEDLETQEVKVIGSDDLPQRARWTIIATACLLLLMCLMLVGITLRMAPIIDEMVRQENERLMKETIERGRFGKNFTEFAAAAASSALLTVNIAPLLSLQQRQQQHQQQHQQQQQQQLQMTEPRALELQSTASQLQLQNSSRSISNNKLESISVSESASEAVRERETELDPEPEQ